MIEEYRFPTELKLWKYEIERLGVRYGLKLIPIVYTLVDLDEMSELMATAGFPVVVPHWQNGQESISQKKKSRHGLGGAYELVINTFPAYGYLMRTNTLGTQKLVMAHVCGHVDIDTRSAYFRVTNRNMINTMADYRARFEGYVAEHGEQRVKEFYDTLLSFQWCIDANSLYMRRTSHLRPDAEIEAERQEMKQPKRIDVPADLPASFDEWVNPPEWIVWQKEQQEKHEERMRDLEKGIRLPAEPMLDILGFLKYHAPLEEWQRGLVDIVRNTAYYFAPLMRMKGIHEGWATKVHEELASQVGILSDAEIFPFADITARVQQRFRRGLNPYRAFYELLHDIEFRWDTGRHGDAWERCESADIKRRWDEFIVFKNIFEETQGDEIAFEARWREFSAFATALKEGRLEIPKEFFIRDLQTKYYLIPTWMRYLRAEEEHADFSRRLREMSPYEAMVDNEFRECFEKEGSDADPKLVRNKVRKMVYLREGREGLYCWTTDEIKREISSLNALIKFKKELRSGQYLSEWIEISEEWRRYAQRFPGTIDVCGGKEKIFEVTETCDDLMILEEFFTPEFCLDHSYFLYKAKPVWDWSRQPVKTVDHYFFEGRTFERVKKALLWQYTNFRQPYIYVVDGNYNKNGELLLRHDHKGVDLDYWSEGGMHVKDVLGRLYKIWGRAVHLETIKSKKPEQKPWWEWYRSAEKDTGDPEVVKGVRVRFSWGPYKAKARHVLGVDVDEVGFFEEEIDQIEFPAPF